MLRLMLGNRPLSLGSVRALAFSGLRLLRWQTRPHHERPLWLPEPPAGWHLRQQQAITREKIADRMLSGLKDRRISSRAFAAEMNRLNRERRAHGDQDRKALAKFEKAVAGSSRQSRTTCISLE